MLERVACGRSDQCSYELNPWLCVEERSPSDGGFCQLDFGCIEGVIRVERTGRLLYPKLSFLEKLGLAPAASEPVHHVGDPSRPTVDGGERRALESALAAFSHPGEDVPR